MRTTASSAEIPAESRLAPLAFSFAFLASVSGFVSIAASHLFLGAALVTLLAAHRRLEFPPVLWPLGLFLGWTVVSALASDDPAASFPQIKKFYVFLMLPVIYSAFRTVSDAGRLMQGWFVAAAAATAVSFVQFGIRWKASVEAGDDFLAFYAPDRITGFFSHWMTFSQVALLAAVMLAAYLLFSRGARRAPGVWLALLAIVVTGLVLSFTRSVWLAMAAVSAYLAWRWNPRLLWAVPVLIAALAAAAPGPVQQRLASIANPGPSEARPLMWRTGWKMIQDRPLFGVGPERVGPLFEEYAQAAEYPPAYYGHLHSIYVHYAAERGLPALAALLWLLGKILWDLDKARRRLPPRNDARQWIVTGVIAATLAVMVTGVFDLTLGDSEILAAFLALAAIGYRAAEN